MVNPVLVDVLRDKLVESHHRGAFAVVNAQGTVLARAGAINATMYPRSAMKTMQALALVESGAADRFRLPEAALALACASHMGARRHADMAATMLAAAGLDISDLDCGPQVPRDPDEHERLIRLREAPSALHNNCSGKHAAFLAIAQHWEVTPHDYVAPAHPVQAYIREILCTLCDVPEATLVTGMDGCSAPAYALPLYSFALGLARLAAPGMLAPERAQAARRLFTAQQRHPVMVAGLGRLDTALIQAGQGRIIVKCGAEAVYAAMLPGQSPDQGIGIALKIDDGADRAAQSAMCELLVRQGVLDASHPAIQGFHRPALRNRTGRLVGQIRPAEAAFG